MSQAEGWFCPGEGLLTMWVTVKTGMLSHYVFIAAVAEAILHLPAMFLHTFWCGGLCAAH